MCKLQKNYAPLNKIPFFNVLVKNIFYFNEKDAKVETNPHKTEPHIVSVIAVFKVYFSMVE